MTDDSEVPSESNDDALLNKVDAVLLRYRKESSAVIHPKERVSPFSISSRAVGRQAENKSASVDIVVPTLTEKCLLPSANISVESDISLLLSYAFDAALRETQIHLNPVDRLMLFQALSRRLPKNL
jgi:hypothetical protein